MPSLAGSGRTGGREAHKMKTLMVSALLALLIPAPAAGRRGAARSGAGLPRAPCTRSSLPRAASPRLFGIARRRTKRRRRRRRTFRLLSFIRVARGLGVLCVCARFKELLEIRSALRTRLEVAARAGGSAVIPNTR